MKYKIFIYLFITLFSTSSTSAFDWSVPLYSVFSSFLQKLGYFSWITDHFICANNQEIYETIQEIKQVSESNKLRMQEYARTNGEIWYEKAKQELEERIVVPLTRCAQSSLILQDQTEQLKKQLLKFIENWNNKRINNVKIGISKHKNTVDNAITDIIEKLAISQEKRDTLVCNQHHQLFNLVTNLQIKIDQKHLELLNSLSKNSSEQRETLIQNHEQQKGDIADVAQRYEQNAHVTSQKLVQVKRLCLLLSTRLQQEQKKNKDLEEQIALLKTAQAQKSYSSIYNTFNKSSFSGKES